MEITKGDMLEILDGYMSYLKKHRQRIAEEVSRGLNQRAMKGSMVSSGTQWWSWEVNGKQIDVGVGLAVKRLQSNRERLEED